MPPRDNGSTGVDGGPSCGEVEGPGRLALSTCNISLGT